VPIGSALLAMKPSVFRFAPASKEALRDEGAATGWHAQRGRHVAIRAWLSAPASASASMTDKTGPARPLSRWLTRRLML